jgi:hypothetical protein
VGCWTYGRAALRFAMVRSVAVREGTSFASFGGEEQCRWIRYVTSGPGVGG